MKHTLIIAEAGVNHNGSIDAARELIEVAASAGADIVKFQTFKSEKLVSKFAKKAEYQKENTGNDESQLDMLKKLELSEESHYRLIEHCDKNKIQFLSTPFDLESIDFLNKLNLNYFKIPSGEITNLHYLRKVGSAGKEVILSTGMSTLDEIGAALGILTKSGTSLDKISVLHCNTEYPTPFEDVNLNAMLTIKKTFGVRVGYSDHTPGIEVPIAAVALGATIIEKHFTLDKNLPGPDHKASLNPAELIAMITSIRNIEKAMGSEMKEPSNSEVKNKVIARKSIVASRDIQAGEIFSEENITVKRPGNGISPMRWDEILGLRANRYYAEDELID
jgi:N,N'-diacetyllegionaminate synthase